MPEIISTVAERFSRLSDNTKSVIVFSAAICLICLTALWLS